MSRRLLSHPYLPERQRARPRSNPLKTEITSVISLVERGKGTFQLGISAAETAAVARRAGLVPVTGSAALPLPAVSHILLAKPER
ncbi:hypothetical protein [Streptomyces virginiae]|uniref:hypothetical protein n=1 Tax=Streptomyces virginiae TaxID=1961 RepID=UPI00367C7BB2